MTENQQEEVPLLPLLLLSVAQHSLTLALSGSFDVISN